MHRGAIFFRILALIGAMTWSVGAAAQALGAEQLPSVRPAVDRNGVDVITGQFRPPTQTTVNIGSGAPGSLSLDVSESGMTSLNSTLRQEGGRVIVKLGAAADSFTQSGPSFLSTEGNGSTLTLSGGVYVYRSASGVEARYRDNSGYDHRFMYGELARLESVKYPDGTTIRVSSRVELFCGPDLDGGNTPTEQNPNLPCPYGEYIARVDKVTSSNGYELRVEYASNILDPVDASTIQPWSQVTDVVALDNSVQVCSASMNTCNLSPVWARESTSAPPPFPVTVTYDPSGRVATATNRGATYTYTYVDNGVTRLSTVTAPNGAQTVYTSDPAKSVVLSVRDVASGATTVIARDGFGRLTRETRPEGDYTHYDRDPRGNIREIRTVAKTGWGLADIVTTAGYDQTCSNPVTCNQPNYVVDPLGNRTDYTYDPTHGGVTRVQLPAPTAGAARPEVNYNYTALQAQTKDAAGNLQSTGVSQYLVTQIRSCSNAATCPGSAAETVVSIAYNNPNLLPTSTTTVAGDGSVSATTSYAYDVRDNLAAIDGPLPGPEDTTSFFYDVANRRRGVIGPDPDGGGSRQRVGERYTFNAAS